MALPFPLIPVLVGAAAGAAITFLLTKASARRRLRDSLEDLGDSVVESAEDARDAAEDAFDEASGKAEEIVSKVRKRR
jgi:gas vesicle protein